MARQPLGFSQGGVTGLGLWFAMVGAPPYMADQGLFNNPQGGGFHPEKPSWILHFFYSILYSIPNGGCC
jgi:hypothetical protein